MRFASSVLWIAVLGQGLVGADEEQIRWIKLEEARARSFATGKPVFVFCMTDLIPAGPPTKLVDRAFTSDPVRARRDDFYFVKCCDLNTAKAVKATSKCEMIVLDPDGDELHRQVATGAQEIADAMAGVLSRYADRPITWTADAPAPEDRTSTDKKMTVLLFRNELDDALAIQRSLEDRAVAKLHFRCGFVAVEYRPGSEAAAKWNILGAPTLLLLDAGKEFGPKAILERTSGRKTPRELRTFLRKGLAAIDKGQRR